MSGRTAFGPWALLALAFATPARADSRPFPINIESGALASALQDLTRQTGAELLYDRRLVRGLRSRPIQGRLTAEAALRQLLRGTGLTSRRSASGAWLIERSPVAPSQSRPRARPEHGQPPREQADLDVPEILVTGIRSQNADIRRRENDIQPYRVDRGEEVVSAHRDDVDQYFSTRVTGNTEVLPVVLRGSGETRSEIDLRGLGPGGTLVLLDGRRLPSIPVSGLEFNQPDINAVPLHAIERIETLTGTAGGIYGFGALGGVVNVVLRRDYRGAELHVTGGLSTRGDAGRLALEGRLGFTPDHGRTDVMLYVSRVRGDPVLTGQRNFLFRDRIETAARAPDLFFERQPVLDAITVFGAQGEELVFKPEYGGGSLGSDHSFLPTGFSGTRADLVAALTAHSGQFELRPGRGTGIGDIGANGKTEALIANLRHRFGAGWEAYLDVTLLRNRGRFERHEASAFQFLSADTPTNPFAQSLFVYFPLPDRDLIHQARVDSARYTAGLIAPLPFGWRGIAEATLGRLKASDLTTLNHQWSGFFDTGQLDIFGDWKQFQAGIASSFNNAFFGDRARNRYDEQSLRLAGPLFHTAAGPATLTLLAERRRESIPSSTSSTFFGAIGPDISESKTASRGLTNRSVYAELRSRLFGDGAFAPVRDLEIQLALRHDEERVDFSRNPDTLDDSLRLRRRFSGTAFTAGAKVSPLSWLILRGSYATGDQPPSLPSLIDREDPFSFIFAHDPKRGGSFPGFDGVQLVDYLDGGSADLTTSHAATLSLGAIVEPLGDLGPRLSLDYSRIRRTHDFYEPSDQTILDHEAFWPDRIVRAPLSDEDRALGYTGGRITRFDSRGLNGEGREVETIDGRVEWPLRFLGGRLRLYGAATWQLRNVEHRLFAGDIEHVGWAAGPLEWRANGGFDWNVGATTFGSNVQYFGRYRLTAFEDTGLTNSSVIRAQGSQWVPAQTYVDLYARRRFRLGGAGSPRELEVDFGIVNLLDTAPPRESAYFRETSFSPYGDPRQRRVELTLSSSF
ncbi:MAG: TonB-dependent receptor [Alphaproteobacteria bacterium]|nr:TonB-dependent receptor [Alphaproteobacteria bacterium]MBV9372313.1 TonB-dependent receptor [Alphaproteobacteria bacterium]MBV9899605.1 TonB-dependent receptor [Alphaproteobacteria bacterium]